MQMYLLGLTTQSQEIIKYSKLKAVVIQTGVSVGAKKWLNEFVF